MACVLSVLVPALANAQNTTRVLNVSAIIALTNANRATHGVNSLTESKLLDIAAQEKANDMIARGYFSHFGPGGQTPWSWFTLVGYYYTCAGENLAMNFDDAGSLDQAWMNSPNHRGNILNGAYTQIGIGIAHGYYQGTQTTFVVQLFAAPAKLAVQNSSARHPQTEVSGTLATSL